MHDDHNSDDSIQNNAHKGVGLSRKLCFIATLSIALLLIGVMILIFSYRGSKKETANSDQSLLVQPQTTITSEDEIRELNEHQQNGALITAKQTASKAATDTGNQQQLPQSLQNNTIPDRALSAPISVMNNFQGVSRMPMPETNVSANNNTSLSSNRPALTADSEKTSDTYQTQNDQDQKTTFLQANQSSSNFYLSSHLTKPVSSYEVKAGTIISATLLTGIDSDLPGEIIAQVSQNIYDTVTGNYLLIPQGTRVIGVYDSKVAYGQSRVLIAWSRLIYPDGDSFDLQGQPGADLMGMAGLHDEVNNHYIKIFGSALAFSMFGALGQLSQPSQSQNAAPSNAQIIYGAIGQNLTQAGIQLTEKNMNIQPTITIRPGTNFTILLTRDMLLPGAYSAHNT